MSTFTDKPTDNFFRVLQERGLLQDYTPGIEAHVSNNKQTAYIGFDPTASSLHVGNLATLSLLARWIHCGHHGLALIGGATGMIGDPSGKSSERNLLDEATLNVNVKSITAQLSYLLNAVGCQSHNVVNNLDWIGSLSLIDFLRSAGKLLTVNYMTSKDSVRKRLETGLSFTEFSYQLLQAYDFLHLYKNMHCTVQMGGSDQWGNITSGTEMIRRAVDGSGHAITTPLVTKADGTKFGKSESGNIWLDAALTSPYKFYQFWLNQTDEDVFRYLCVFTFLPYSELITLREEHALNPGVRAMQKKLAGEVTRWVHGQTEVDKAIETAQILFGKPSAETFARLTEADLFDIFEGVPTYDIFKEHQSDLLTALSVGTGNALFSSKGEARKLIEQGGMSLNLEKITSETTLEGLGRIAGKYIVGQKGKKNWFLLKL